MFIRSLYFSFPVLSLAMAQEDPLQIVFPCECLPPSLSFFFCGIADRETQHFINELSKIVKITEKTTYIQQILI